MESINTVKISEEFHIILCRKAIRELAVELDFSVADQTRLVTTVSELARNIVQHAGSGRMALFKITSGLRKGIRLLFEDNGPGVDPDEVLQDGFSTGPGLGMGLPGARRLMDEFKLESEKSHGTRITAVKWLRE